MKKLHLPFLLTTLLLTSCNLNGLINEPINEPIIETSSEEIVEPKQEQSSSKEIKEEISPNIIFYDDIKDDSEPLMYDTIGLPLKSPVYRPSGTTDIQTLDLGIRSYEATITDSGRVNQKMDIVYLDYNYGGLEDLGYYWLDVRIELTAREVNDGYQYLFLYNTPYCQSVGESLLENFIPCVGDDIKQGMLYKEQFEIGPGYKKTSWENRVFRFYVYVGNMVDNLYLRYGANGILADTWVNKDIKVSITPKMTKN